MQSTLHPNRLIAIGGSEDKAGSCLILREVVALAGGRKSRILVMPIATMQPKRIGKAYQLVFEQLGAGSVDIMEVGDRKMLNSPGNLKHLEKATAVFFTGGDQLRITGLLGGTEMETLLHRKHETEDFWVAGTSAGAAMMSTTMIAAGLGGVSAQYGAARTSPGLEFFPGAFIDPHFAQRGRIGRLLATVAQYPHNIGLGIDEDTALVVQKGRFHVTGSGAVTVVDAGAVGYTNLQEAKLGDCLALFGVHLHLLPHGYSYDLENRKPIGAAVHAD